MRTASQTLTTRRFGSTDLELTTVGFDAWAIGRLWPGVTGAIVGARNPAQVDGWVDAATVQFSAEDLGEIAGALRGTRAGSGLVEPAVVSAVAAAVRPR